LAGRSVGLLLVAGHLVHDFVIGQVDVLAATFLAGCYITAPLNFLAPLVALVGGNLAAGLDFLKVKGAESGMMVEAHF
jgi:hypothetical protein